MSTVDEVYSFSQHSDNFIDIRCVDQNGIYQPATDFTAVEYIIARTSGQTMLALTLGNGVEVVSLNDEFLFRVHIDDQDILFSGNYYDQFVTWDSSGNKEKPRFKRKIRIEKVFLP